MRRRGDTARWRKMSSRPHAAAKIIASRVGVICRETWSCGIHWGEKTVWHMPIEPWLTLPGQVILCRGWSSDCCCTFSAIELRRAGCAVKIYDKSARSDAGRESRIPDSTRFLFLFDVPSCDCNACASSRHCIRRRRAHCRRCSAPILPATRSAPQCPHRRSRIRAIDPDMLLPSVLFLWRRVLAAATGPSVAT